MCPYTLPYFLFFLVLKEKKNTWQSFFLTAIISQKYLVVVSSDINDSILFLGLFLSQMAKSI